MNDKFRAAEAMAALARQEAGAREAARDVIHEVALTIRKRMEQRLAKETSLGEEMRDGARLTRHRVRF